ncbi:efflux RND transporter periplasmic adaptor subunit [Shewanella sp. YIC-542]|uniref:efflux RND transporter periplasmic adaptor subunit n=1 Tax=Shewanella mytili TaxID=3377111 RepID=UPI00398F3273
MKFSSTHISAIAVAGIMTLMLSGCGEEQTTKKEEAFAIPVEVTTVTTGQVSSYYNTTATLEAPEEANVATRIAGVIEQIYVEEGDRVKKGQLLAQIDARQQRYQLAHSEAEVKILSQELARYRKMKNPEFISADSVSKLEYSLQSAIAQRDLAALQVTESEIRSPIDGVIAGRFIKEGNMAKEFDKLFYVVQQDELYGIMHLPEQQLASLKTGQEAQVFRNKNDYAAASVLRISPVIDSTSGTFKVTLLVPNHQQQLKAGMFTRVQLKYDTHSNVLVVPYNAVVNQDDRQALYIIKEGKAQYRDVTLGYRQNDQVEVISGINPGEQVVIRGQHNLKDQSLVDVLSPLTLTAAK